MNANEMRSQNIASDVTSCFRVFVIIFGLKSIRIKDREISKVRNREKIDSRLEFVIEVDF